MARTVRRATATKTSSTTKATSATQTKGRSTKRTATASVASTGMADVPESKYADTYVNRKVGNYKDFEILDKALARKHNVLIEGDTGTGKTSLAMAYAAHKGLPFYSVSSSRGVDPTQLFGKYIPDGSGGFVWQDGAVTHMVRHGGVLLINEINFLPEGIASVLFGLLDKRRKIELVDHKSEVIYAPDNLLIIADFNEGYRGTRPLNEALRNRFAVQLHFNYDKAIETKLIKSPTLRHIADSIRDRIAAGEFDTPVSTNMLIEFEQIAEDFDIPFAVANFVNHFQVDDRAALKGVFDTSESNLVQELKVADNSTDSASGSDWATEDVDWEYSEDDFYSVDDLVGMSLEDLRTAAYETDATKRQIDAMDIEELRRFLTGDHPHWKEG